MQLGYVLAVTVHETFANRKNPGDTKHGQRMHLNRFAKRALVRNGLTFSHGAFVALGVACGVTMLLGLVSTSQATLPGQNGDILFALESGGVFTAGQAGGDPHRVTNVPASATQPAISPNGGKVAFVGDDQNIYLSSPRSSKPPMQMTFDGSNHGPVFSPDGGSILYFHQRIVTNVPKGQVESDLTEVPVSGGNTEVISVVPGFAGTIDVSPNGERIAYGDPGIVTMNRDGTGLKVLTDAGYDPSFSPDGRHIAYAASVGLHNQVATMRSDGSSARVLTSFDSGAGLPEYSPDGTKIAFAGFAGGSNGVYVQKVKGTTAARKVVDSPTGVGLGGWVRKAPFLIQRIYGPNIEGLSTYFLRGFGARVFGPGRIVLKGPGIRTRAAMFDGPGSVSVALKPRFKRRLIRSGGGKLTIRGTFYPDGALSSSIKKTFNLRFH